MGNGATRLPVVVSRDDLPALLDAVRARGYTVVGPTVRDGAIQAEVLHSVDQLPIGWGDEQAPGSYRLRRRDDDQVFGWAVGPGSAKQWLFPSEERLWSADREGESSTVRVDDPVTKLAFFGVRPCEVAAIAVRDRVFMGSPTPDRSYSGRRRGALLIAVDCGEPSGTCFCVSMGTGPRAEAGFDLALTEVRDD